MRKLLAVLLMLGVTSVWASGDYSEPKPKPSPTPTPTASPVPEYRGDATHHILGYAAVGVAMTAVLKDSAHPTVYGFGATTALAAVGEGLRDGPFNARNMWYNALGAAIGSVGLGIVVGPNYLGWQKKW